MSQNKPLKLAILFHGLSLDSETLGAFQTRDTKFGHGLFDFSGNDKNPWLIPQEVWLDSETVVRVHNQVTSPYSLRFEDERLVVADSCGNRWPVELSSRPRFYDLLLPDKTFGHQHCQINGADRLNIYALNFCAFTRRNVACRFCNVSDSGQTLQISVRKKVENVARVVSAAYEEGAFRHFCFSGGVFPDAEAAMRVFIDLCEAIQERTGLRKLDGDISLVPPLDLDWLDSLAETGITTLSMNLEVLDEKLFQYICPGKHEIGLPHYQRAFERAVKRFGSGRVRSNLVLGLEPLSSFKLGTKRLAEMGVVPTTNVYWQSTPNYLRHPDAESLDYYREAYRWLDELYKSYGLEPPWCAQCTIATMDHETGSLLQSCF